MLMRGLENTDGDFGGLWLPGAAEPVRDGLDVTFAGGNLSCESMVPLSDGLIGPGTIFWGLFVTSLSVVTLLMLIVGD